MVSKPAKIPSWYTQSGKEFRIWVAGLFRDGELGRIIATHFQRRKLRYRIVKVFKTKPFKAASIVSFITIAGYLIQKEEGTPWQKTIFENLESIAIGSAAIIFISEIKERQKRDHYEAWQVINSAMQKPGNGGRIQALEDLNKDGVDLEGVAAPGADLSGINLQGANLKRANFLGAHLDGANLSGANLEGAFLDGANLSGANLTGACLNDAYLRKANLREAILCGANLTMAYLKGSIIDECTQLDEKWLLVWKVNNTSAENLDLRNADLSCAYLENPYLPESDLSEANLQGTRITLGSFYRTNLHKANLSGVDFQSGVLQEANLSEANLQGAKLKDINLHGANFSGANLQGANLQEADLQGANLQGANLQEADLQGANLNEANFSGADLSKAKNLGESQFTLSMLCQTTLPEGFTLNSDRDCKFLGIEPDTEEIAGI